jgi:hypothetical protein
MELVEQVVPTHQMQKPILPAEYGVVVPQLTDMLLESEYARNAVGGGSTGDMMLDALVQAANKTVLFMRTVCVFREAYWLNASLTASNHTSMKTTSAAANTGAMHALHAADSAISRNKTCILLKSVLAENTKILQQWRDWWPEEGSDWMLTDVTPKLWAHAYWMTHRGQYPPDRRSMHAWVLQLQSDSGKLCKEH